MVITNNYPLLCALFYLLLFTKDFTCIEAAKMLSFLSRKTKCETNKSVALHYPLQNAATNVTENPLFVRWGLKMQLFSDPQ